MGALAIIELRVEVIGNMDLLTMRKHRDGSVVRRKTLEERSFSY